MTEQIGFHACCGGAVRREFYQQKKDGTRTECYVCARCRSQVLVPRDVVAEPITIARQKTCGIKQRRPRFDIKSWREIK